MSAHATPHSPKGGPRGHTPPRSPSGEKYLGRTLSPKTSGSLFMLDSGGKSPGLHGETGFGQNSTTLTSSFENSDSQASSKSRQQMQGANNASNFAQN